MARRHWQTESIASCPAPSGIHDYGGPEALKFEDVSVGQPGPGEVLLAQKAIGINFIDVYQRTGLYKLPALPAMLGLEGAGDVVAVGDGVSDLEVGDRVAYAGCAGGIRPDNASRPPTGWSKFQTRLSYDTAAAMMLQGMTVRYLLRETYRVAP